jgi:hypothetical protein
MYSCPSCRASVASDALFCGECGTPQRVIVNGPLASTVTAQTRKRRLSNGRIIVYSFVGLTVLFFVLLIIQIQHDPSATQSTQDDQGPTASETIRAQLRKELDPPGSAHFTPREHLQAAKRLLAQIDINSYAKSEALIQLISEHAKQADIVPRVPAIACRCPIRPIRSPSLEQPPKGTQY